MVTLGSIRLVLRLVRWLVKWLRERKKRKGGEMDSRQVSQILKGISEWHPFNELNEQGLKNVPEQRGIYILRMAQGKPFGRLNGESDICYIGSTEKLGERFKDYLHPSPMHWTDIRIHDMAKKYNMEFAWCIFEKVGDREQKLLNRYRMEHDELPPLNHIDIIKLKDYIPGITPLPPDAFETPDGAFCPIY